MKAKLVIFALALGAGCVNPRSVVVGQSPRMLTQGDVEVGIATGIAWDSFAASTGSSGSATVQLPANEANVALGMGAFDLNLHVSTAGLQPGVKISLPSAGLLTMAVMPSIAGGFFAGNSTTTTGLGTENTPINAWTAMGGLKFLAAIPAGLYGAAGYDFQVFRWQGAGGTGSSSGGLTSHHVGLAIGWEFKLGQMSLRPEFAMSYSPAVFVESTQPQEPRTELMVFPNVTVAFAAPSSGGAR